MRFIEGIGGCVYEYGVDGNLLYVGNRMMEYVDMWICMYITDTTNRK